MKTPALPFFAFAFLWSLALAQDPKTPPPPDSTSVAPEREGTATILHRDDVLRDRGGPRHLWPLLNTPEARMNYFEVTVRGPLHYHPDADHRLYVLEGSVLVTVGATTTKCTVGDFIIIPRGVRHRYDIPEPGGKALLLTFDAPPFDPKKTVTLEPAPPAK
jgi:quercetin dioxygenase-like cupin family protein